MRLRMLMVLLAIAALVLSACTGPSTKEEIYNHLEKAVTLEDAFRKQQQPLVELENKEQKLYNQIIDLSMDEFDKIKQLSKEAADIVEERESKIEVEKESIQAAKEEFDKIKPLIEDLDEEQGQAKEKASQLTKIMQKRYDSYQKLYSEYKNALKLDGVLYEMLQKKDLTEQDLQTHIEKLNEAYSQVIEANKQFNQHTEEYNSLKKDFYEAAGLNVTYEESAEEEEEKSTSKNKDSGNANKEPTKSEEGSS